MKHVGKPTKYREEYIQEVYEYIENHGREQTSLPTVEGFARYIRVHKDSINEWRKVNPEFDNALKDLLDSQKIQLMNDGLYGGKEVNAGMAIFLLKVNHDMVEKSQTDITSAGEKLQAPTIILDTKVNNEK